MQVFDRVDSSSLDRSEMRLWILALTMIVVLAVGVALLMYPMVQFHPEYLPDVSARVIFFGFCGLAALLVGYFIDRQMVIRRLRAELANEKRQVAEIRQEASTDLLTTFPGLNIFRDRLAMEYRRASSTHQPLSLLAVELKPSHRLSHPGEIETAFGDAAKTLMHKLRGDDSIFLVAPGVFGIILPVVSAGDAYKLRDRLLEGLHDAAGPSNRFSFAVTVYNFPEHFASAREMEESIRGLLLRPSSKNSNLTGDLRIVNVAENIGCVANDL